MAYEIIWLPKAEERFDEIIAYLLYRWSETQVTQFVKRTWHVLGLIRENPFLYRHSGEKDIYEAVITKHNLLLYRVKDQRIELLTFFDTRQDPKKKKG